MRASRSRVGFPSAAALPVAFGLWLVVTLVVAATLWRERFNELHEVELDTQATTALLKAHTANTFQAVDTALGEIARTLGTDELRRNDAGFRASMRQRLAGMPYVRALYVIGPDGHIVHDTDYPATPDVSLADRDYFARHRSSDSLDTSVSAPIQSRSGAGWSWP